MNQRHGISSGRREGNRRNKTRDLLLLLIIRGKEVQESVFVSFTHEVHNERSVTFTANYKRLRSEREERLIHCFGKREIDTLFWKERIKKQRVCVTFVRVMSERRMNEELTTGLINCPYRSEAVTMHQSDLILTSNDKTNLVDGKKPEMKYRFLLQPKPRAEHG